MRRIALTGLVSLTLGGITLAQLPPMSLPATSGPTLPSEPGRLPNLGSRTPGATASNGPTVGSNSPGVTISNGPIKGDNNLPPPRPAVALVRAEKPIALGSIEVIQQNGQWQVMAGKTLFSNTGQDWKTAEKISNVLRALQFGEVNGQALNQRDFSLTSWNTIGEARPVIGYVSVKGEASRTAKGVTHQFVPVDLNTVRVEQVRGVWVVRDARTILLNFGTEQREAEQAVAVAMHFGFNRIGYLGTAESASLRYFYAEPNDQRMAVAPTPSSLQVLAQEMALDRTGVDIPGVGTVGQKILLDPRKMSVRKDGTDFVLVSGTDILSKFGRDEWSARDAMRIIQQMNPTAVVTIGSPGITFFLSGNDVQNRLPFGTMGAPFESEKLSVRQTLDGVFHLYEPLGREIARAKSKGDIEAIQAAIRYYKLNRTCSIGTSPATTMSFLGRVN